MSFLQFKKQKGITLIALVVTIIVLLILAGVSISMIAGENGILGRAREASEQTELATERDQRQLAMLEAVTNTERTYFQGVPIPAGFAPTRIAGESTVDEGLVIIDSQGNEFVWIPCVAESSEVGDTGKVYYNTAANDDNREEKWRGYQYYYNGGEWYDSQPHEIGEPSIAKEGNGGFYVARYEAGVPENANFYVDDKMSGESLNYKQAAEKNYTTPPDPTEADNNKQDISPLAPVSKKGSQVWNYISQKNAKTVAGNMVKNSDVESYLIDSHAWNTICRLIEKKYPETTSEGKTKVTDSTKWGNYYNNTTTKYEKLKGLWAKHESGTPWTVASKYNTGLIPSNTAPKGSGNNRLELATGICEDFKVYNIYDMAGNMGEWTTETGKNNGNSGQPAETACKDGECPAGTETHAVLRGGSFGGDGSGSPVVHADGHDGVGNYDVNVGFRVVLYLK